MLKWFRCCYSRKYILNISMSKFDNRNNNFCHFTGYGMQRSLRVDSYNTFFINYFYTTYIRLFINNKGSAMYGYILSPLSNT